MSIQSFNAILPLRLQRPTLFNEINVACVYFVCRYEFRYHRDTRNLVPAIMLAILSVVVTESVVSIFLSLCCGHILFWMLDVRPRLHLRMPSHTAVHTEPPHTERDEINSSAVLESFLSSNSTDSLIANDTDAHDSETHQRLHTDAHSDTASTLGVS